MPKLTGSIVKYPARASILWYLAVIALGALLLAQPICRSKRASRIDVLDATFTATSATCVTGLVVRSTGQDFSWLGQLVILLLIQFGGVGIMTVTTYAVLRLGGRTGLRQRVLVGETLGSGDESDLRWVLKHVLLMTVAFEGAGFVLLAVRNLFEMPFGEALWHAVFHSISAFCNAGFSLNDDSLIRYQDDPLVNATIMLLIVVGGIGFPVMLDLKRNWRGRLPHWDPLTLHTKLMLLGTVGLLAFGMLSFLGLEWDGVLSGLPLGQSLMVSLFHSVTCRTAGFNTVDVAHLTNATLFLSMLLMMIGAGPCSTGGGFKVSTFMVLALRGWATTRGHHKVNIFRRTLAPFAIERATTTALLFTIVIVTALTALLTAEQSDLPHLQAKGVFVEAAFEIVSALGTVGLSTGITNDLTDFARWLIILLMFIGRLGPISVAVALTRGERSQPIEFPQEEPLVG